MPSWNILCDFDGTISTCDVTDALLAQFAYPDWQQLEDSWQRGEIGSRECMSRQVALLDASADEIAELVDGIEIDPDFPEFVARAHAAGIPITIASDGLDWAIDRILRRHGLDHLPVIANQLKQTGERSWRMVSPNARDACRSGSGTCKCARAEQWQASSRQVLLIGDGRSDYCVAAAADHVFAKARLLDHCRECGIAHSEIEGFLDALRLLPAVVAGHTGTGRNGGILITNRKISA